MIQRFLTYLILIFSIIFPIHAEKIDADHYSATIQKFNMKIIKISLNKYKKAFPECDFRFITLEGGSGTMYVSIYRISSNRSAEDSIGVSSGNSDACAHVYEFDASGKFVDSYGVR